MMKLRGLFTTMLALIFLLLSLASVLAAKKAHFLDNLDGTWRGKGTVIRKPGAKKEAMRCRLKNNRKNNKLVLRGNCSFGITLIPMTGWIQKSGRNHYKASFFKSFFLPDTDKFLGKLEKNSLKFNLEGEDKISNKIIKTYIVIHNTNEDSFNITISKVDVKTGNPFRMTTIRFFRKQ